MVSRRNTRKWGWWFWLGPLLNFMALLPPNFIPPPPECPLPPLACAAGDKDVAAATTADATIIRVFFILRSIRPTRGSIMEAIVAACACWRCSTRNKPDKSRRSSGDGARARKALHGLDIGPGEDNVEG